MVKEATKVMNDNSVGRLYNLIEELKQTDGADAEEVFSKVFSLKKDDKASILTNYAELFKLCTLGINEIEQLNPKNINKFKDTLNNVINGISKIYFNASDNPLVTNGMAKFNSYFNRELMISLEYCADYLSEHSNEENIEDEKIQELIEEINEMIKYVLNCKLNNELEKVLVYQLNSVRESLLKYKFYGSQGVINSISTTLGTLILNREKVDDDKSFSTVDKIFQIMGKINAIISFKSNSATLLGNIYKKLIGKE